MSDVERLKQRAAIQALSQVRSGMVVGLGSGSTADHMIRELGRRLHAGELHSVRGVPTSHASEALARREGIPIADLSAAGVDVAIDGMDELNPALDAIKGLGAALSREKVVAMSAKRFILIGDLSKRVPFLGSRAPVPVEVLAFGWRRTEKLLQDLGARTELRKQHGDLVVTDNGQLIIDCHMPGGFDAPTFATAVDGLPGVVTHGLFLGVAERAYLAGPNGVEEILAPHRSTSRS